MVILEKLMFSKQKYGCGVMDQRKLIDLVPFLKQKYFLCLNFYEINDNCDQ